MVSGIALVFGLDDRLDRQEKKRSPIPANVPMNFELWTLQSASGSPAMKSELT